MSTTWNGDRITIGVRNAIMRGLVSVGNDVRNYAINSIVEGPKTGAVYSRGGKVHQASAPGEPPAGDIGTLQNSITLRIDAAKLNVYVNAGARYAAALEYGTVRMEPRPFLRPALAVHTAQINARVTAEVRAYLAGGGR